MDIRNQDKLVNLQVHLRNDTYKGIQQFLDETWRGFLDFYVDKFDKNCDMLTRIQFVPYLSGLYVHGVIDSSLIVKSLNSYVKNPHAMNNPSFTAMFTTVEDKLKKDVSELRMQTYTEHLVKKIIAGHENSPILPDACQLWLAKKEKERRAAKKTETEAKNSAAISLEVVEFYCHGARSLSQVLKDFEEQKSLPTESLNKIANATVKLTLSEDDFGKKLVHLLKNLSSWMLFGELNKKLLVSLRSQMKEFHETIDYTNHREKNFRLVRFLTDLYMEGLIDKELIVECLTMCMGALIEHREAFFHFMYQKVIKKLSPKITGKQMYDFREYELDVMCILRAEEEERSKRA